MVAAMQKSVEKSIETHHGACIAVDDETGTEYGHKWRNGEARVYHEDEDEERDRGVEYVFAVRVVLVAVEPE
jgi:hypothetical protein